MPKPHKYVAADKRVSWKVRFRVHHPVSGKLVETSETFGPGPGSEAEAWNFCRLIQAVGTDEAVRILAEREADESLPTVAEWVERYVTDLTSIGEGTRVEYNRTWNRTWKPLIGHYRLGELNKSHVAGALNELSTRLSDKSIANAWGSFFAPAMREAHEEGLIEKNPLRGVKLPRLTEHEKVEHRYLSHDEFDQLLEETPALWKPLVITFAGTGIRWGEAQALTVGDAQLDAKTPVLRVIKAAKWSGVQARKTGPTKTRRSRRTVTLPPQVVEALRPLVKDRARGEPLFTVAGKPLKHNYFYKQAWRPLLKRAELDEPWPRIHDLRHTHVAWLIALGIGLPVIQARLGHESIKTTIDEYGHLMPDIQAAAAHAASVAFSQVASLSTGAELTAIETGPSGA